MKKPKLTPWFHGINPARPGVYQQRSGNRGAIGYQRWSGKRWYAWSKTVDDAMRQKCPVSTFFKNDPWRGLAADPNTRDPGHYTGEKQWKLKRNSEQPRPSRLTPSECQKPSYALRRCALSLAAAGRRSTGWSRTSNSLGRSSAAHAAAGGLLAVSLLGWMEHGLRPNYCMYPSVATSWHCWSLAHITQLVQVVGPGGHHLPALGHELSPVIGRPEGAGLAVRELGLDHVRGHTKALHQ